MPGIDFILGLPDIPRNFVDLLTLMLRVTTDEVSSVALHTDMRPGEIIQWSTGEVEESLEEEETPVPVAFGPVLAFMETGYDEARTEYFTSLKADVGDLLATCPDFIGTLQSDLCVDRFVPKE